MKSIYKISILTAALMAASSCLKDEGGLNPQQPREVSIHASSTASKTVLDGNSVKWESGDEIALVFTHPQPKSHVETFSTEFDGGPASYAKFSGTIATGVSLMAGYDDDILAVYPASAVTDGEVSFTLPSTQTSAGSFEPELNLSAAVMSLADMEDDGQTEATFRNSFAIIRITAPSYATAFRITGTAPLAGTAPMKLNNAKDRLVPDLDAEWAEKDKKMTVTLLPKNTECFDPEIGYNVLILPGTHESLKIEMDDEYGNTYTKTVNRTLDFAASKFYSLNPNFENELVLVIDGVEEVIETIDQRLENAEGKAEEMKDILKQVQSVSLMTEYTDNAVYAPYAAFYSSNKGMDIVLDYMVRPASAAAGLAENYSDMLSAKVYDKKAAGSFSFTTLPVKNVTADNGIISVTVDASGLSGSFYTENAQGGLALEISDGNTEITSDFANLIPKQCSAIEISYSEDVLPAIKGATLTFPYQYSSISSDFEVTIENKKNVGNVWFSGNNATTQSGYVNVYINNSDVTAQSFDLVLTSGDDKIVKTLKFSDAGAFTVTSNGAVDYIGGEATVSVTANPFGSYNHSLSNGGDWISETSRSSTGSITYSVKANETYSNRTATVKYETSYRGLMYTKEFDIVQYANGSALTRTYYSDGQIKMLNTSSYSTPLNLVILGDGYQLKDLAMGGKFERSAGSAMDAFFGVEPFKTFKDRFNVYMVTYQSVDEGIDITSSNISKDTYFDTYCAGGSNTLAWFNESGLNTVTGVVKNTLGLSSDSKFYRTIVIVLANTSESAGSCSYPVQETSSDTDTTGEKYRSFSVCVLAANSTGTSGLIRHEAGGHAFGRLGDEYTGKNYADSDLDEKHSKGFYQNITLDQSKWNWNDFIGLDGYEDVIYHQPNGANFWCPSTTSIMYNNAGSFNAPSRRAIYERIIRQTEGYNAYSWSKFLEYDKKNIN